MWAFSECATHHTCMETETYIDKEYVATALAGFSIFQCESFTVAPQTPLKFTAMHHHNTS